MLMHESVHHAPVSRVVNSRYKSLDFSPGTTSSLAAMSTSVSFRHLLTQQQRNNKRQRANPQQLSYLQKMFEVNPRPNYATREVIGRRIDMTPRSVQIWFQNNRAKLKKSNSGYYKPTLRTVVKRELHNITSIQLCDDSDVLENSTSCYSSSDSPETPPGDRISIVNCQSLAIGSWVRVRHPESDSTDLTVYTSDANSSISYTITHSGYLYTLMLPYKAIKGVSLKLIDADANQGVLEIDVQCPEMIEFTCQAGESMGLMPCTDFTGGETWSSLVHQLYGAYDELLEQATPFIDSHFR